MKYFAFISLLLLLSSCFNRKTDNPPVTVTAPVALKSLQDTSIFRYIISKNLVDTSEFKLSYQYFISPKNTWEAKLNQLTAEFIYGSTHFETPDSVQYEASDRFFIACLDSLYNSAVQDYKDSEYSIMWSYDCSTSFTDKHEKFATFSSGMYLYSGGAHGNTYYNHINVEKSSGKELKLNDFISDTAAFFQIADSCFRAQNEISATENYSDLGFWFADDRFYCNDNFYLSEEGFHFIFNVYEIAPYSHGLFEFSVPFEICRELIRYDLSR
ncbi:MAG: RsiV family protein [Bacteroidota bacterium]